MIVKRKSGRKVFAVILSLLLILLSIPAAPFQVSAEQTSLTKKFDFGTTTSSVQDGFIRISSDTAYSAELGYGFAEPSKVTAYDRGTSNSLKSDFIMTSDTSFNVDLPNGDYSVTVIAGDEMEETEVGIKAENVQKIQNSQIKAAEYIEQTFTIALIDGQLNFQFTGKAPKVNGLIIEKLPERIAGALPTVYLAGDSTVQTYDEYWKPEAGWGQMISRYFSSDITFKNHAIGGRSTKSFLNEGRLDTILREIKPNDYFFIQFGHNDATVSIPERYASVPDYKNYLKTYVNGARQRGAIPILVTPVGRRDFNPETGKFNVSFANYVQGMKEVATEMNVNLVDLSARSVAYYDSIGPEGTLSVFLHTDPGVYTAFPNGSQDNTHFQEYGAIQLARLVSDEIKKLNIPLSSYVKGIEPPATVPNQPTNVVASNISNASAVLTWTEVEGADIYKVYRKLSTSSQYSLIGTSTIPRISITGMEDGKTYDLVVSAVNGKGESELSDVIQIKTKEASLKFDFGLAGNPVAEGYTEVNLSTVYSSEKGYGIVAPTGMIGRDRKVGGELLQDWLGYFNVGWKFNVDLPNGLYAAKVYVGDFTGSARTTLAIEGQDYGQISAPRNNYTTKVVSQVFVRDGQMNFSFGGSTAIVNALEITSIDVTAPETKHAIKGVEKEGWYNGPVTVNFTAHDVDTGVEATYYSLNGAEEKKGTTITIEEDGTHILQYWSTDKAGNVESKKEVHINIDQTAPTITFSVQNQTELEIDQKVNIFCQVEDALSGVSSSTCSDISIPAYELGVGTHTFKVEAVDRAGNISSKSVSIVIYVSYDSLRNLTSHFLIEESGDDTLLKSLAAKLNAAKASEEKGHTNARDGQLSAYINEVNAKRNKNFTEKQTEILVVLAELLRNKN